ncbi:MAG TPA: hypothetical protein VGN08_09065 [Solirubrobacteraceae bacterium]
MCVRIVVAVAGGVLVIAMITEIFVAFLLPRRVKRDPRLVRTIFVYGWRSWLRAARMLPDRAEDTALGIYGPLGLIANLVVWLSLLILGYACLQWGGGSHLAAPTRRSVDFGNDLYFSAATMVASPPAGLAPSTTYARVLQVINAFSGLGVAAIVIGYLPSLYQAFSSRETTVSQLDARAGSPPSAGRLILRSGARRGWPAVAEYLSGWEVWAAELMETHLAYPVLAYFRSQHVNQNWLVAMCTILDTCALTIVCAPRGTVDSARFTYAIARHAVVDLSYTFHRHPQPPEPDRLPPDDLRRLLDQLREAGIEPAVEQAHVEERLGSLRAFYEPYVGAIAAHLSLPLPQWLAPDSPTDNWRTTDWH